MEKKGKIRIVFIIFIVLMSSNFIFNSNMFFVTGYRPGLRKNWHVESSESLYHQPLLCDIDADSQTEILFTSYNGLFCLTEEGTLDWTTSFRSYPYPGFVSVDDIAYDTTSEVLYSAFNKLLVFDNRGFYRWGFALNDIITTKAKTADLNNDGFKEVLFGTDHGYIYCLNKFGDHMWNISLGGTIWSDIEVTDFENDGQLEILVGGGYLNNAMHCLNYNGTLRWEYPIGVEAGSPILADLNNDSVEEIIFSTYVGYTVCLNSNGGLEWVYESLWYHKKPGIGDINGDNDLETLFFIEQTKGIGELICLSNIGVLLWKLENIAISSKCPVIHDVDGNGSPDILYSSIKGLICRSNTTDILFTYSYADYHNNLIAPIVYDYESDGKVDILYSENNNLFSLRIYNKTLFYGAYMLPVYIVSLGILVSSIFIIYRGIKTGKFKIKPRKKTYSYTDENGKVVYSEKET
ncbi:MAG: FG-GAP repeat domain-containing protein [Candidatus Heimdallarchaeota archaeon]